MKVKFQLDPTEKIWIYPIGHPILMAELEDLGVHIVDEGADITFAVASAMTEPPSSPTVIFDQWDTTKPTYRATRWENEHVLAYGVPATCDGYSNADILYNLFETNKPVHYLTMMLWHQLEYFHHPPECRKDIDVVFTGSTSHQNAFVRTRRNELLHEWANLSTHFNAVGVFHACDPIHIPRPLDGQQNLDLLARSKVVICPPGNLELCWRDYEAVLAGAAIVKPHLPDGFQCTESPWYENTVWCEPDYSDLTHAVGMAMDVWSASDDRLREDSERLWAQKGRYKMPAIHIRNFLAECLLAV